MSFKTLASDKVKRCRSSKTEMAFHIPPSATNNYSLLLYRYCSFNSLPFSLSALLNEVTL